MAYPFHQQEERLSKVLHPQPVWTGVDGRKRIIKINCLVQHQGVNTCLHGMKVHLYQQGLGLCDCHTSSHRVYPMEAVLLDPLFWHVCTIKLIHSLRWQRIAVVLLSRGFCSPLSSVWPSGMQSLSKNCHTAQLCCSCHLCSHEDFCNLLKALGSD